MTTTEIAASEIVLAFKPRELAGLVAAIETARITAPAEANGYDWSLLEAYLSQALADWRRASLDKCHG
jgi:hypothetical protein